MHKVRKCLFWCHSERFLSAILERMKCEFDIFSTGLMALQSYIYFTSVFNKVGGAWVEFLISILNYHKVFFNEYSGVFSKNLDKVNIFKQTNKKP